MSKLLIDIDPSFLLSKKYKIAFFDLDGTLINGIDTISLPNKNQLDRLRSNGTAISLATGRPYFAAKNVINELQIVAPSLFFSGALIVVPHTGESLFECAIDSEDVSKIVEAASKREIYCELYTKESYFVEKWSYLTDVHLSYLKQRPTITSFEQIIKGAKILKIVLAGEGAVQEKKLRDFMEAFPEFTFGLGHGAEHSAISFLNVTNPKASREHAFKFILDRMKITSEHVIAFGDGEADIPFLRLAGTGVAMGNANDSVKRAAHFVTKRVEEDGVAYALSVLHRD